MSSNAIDSQKVRLKRVFADLQDDVLDEYNNGNISKSEMENIIKWCNKILKMKLRSLEEGRDGLGFSIS
jgi:hypothetical protein